jgi:hypothetical protein
LELDKRTLPPLSPIPFSLTLSHLAGQAVIDLLRDQLSTKAGEIAESRSRVDELTALVASLDSLKSSLQTEVAAHRISLADEKIVFADKLNEAAVAATEVEERHRGRISEVELAWSEKMEGLREGREADRKKFEEGV